MMRRHVGIVAALGVAALMMCGRAQAQLLIVANNSVHATEVSKSDVRDVFTGTASSMRGAAQVSPVLLKSGGAHEELLAQIVGKSDAAFRAAWRSLLFSGQGAVPRTFESETALVEYVARTPGAVGYISRATPHEGVKTLVVR